MLSLFQKVITKILKQMLNRDEIKIEVLNVKKFPNGLEYFEVSNPCFPESFALLAELIDETTLVAHCNV